MTIKINAAFVILSLSATSCLYPSKTLALQIMPEIDNIQILNLLVKDKHKEAADKVQRAFVRQTGIKREYDSAKSFINKTAKTSAEKAAAKITNTLGDSVLTNTRYIASVAGGAYAILISRSFRASFKNPLNNKIKHYVKWSTESTETGLEFNF
jgi:hypothetical protein